MDTIEKEQLQRSFQQRWPLAAVQQMRLEDYNALKETSNGETYCYWLEHRTDALGRIKGAGGAYKFAIYQRSPFRQHKEASGKVSDGTYSFLSKYGDNAETAFASVRDLLVQTIEFATRGDYAAIDHIDLHNIVKWKTAFMYATPNALMPIYKAEKLKEIAEALGGHDVVKSGSLAAMNCFIAAQRPKAMHMYDYAYYLYHELQAYLGQKYQPKYYIVGSKYGARNDWDMFPLMKEKGVISTDHGPKDLSLADVYNHDSSADELLDHIEAHHCTVSADTARQLALFLNIRVGDVVAIKKSTYRQNNHGVLEIHTLAVVESVDGIVYWFDPQLGHCLNVRFIPYEGPPVLPIGGYRSTVTHIIDESNRNAIFGRCAVNTSSELMQVINGPLRKAVDELNTSTYIRRGTSECLVLRGHNDIQQQFTEQLKDQYGPANVHMELNYVDIRVEEPEIITFYEVKNDDRPDRCIRAALGQLLQYAFRHQGSKPIRCIVVGPSEAGPEDEAFIGYLKGILGIDFDYKTFNKQKL
jgi:hypothetical protein